VLRLLLLCAFHAFLIGLAFSGLARGGLLLLGALLVRLIALRCRALFLRGGLGRLLFASLLLCLRRCRCTAHQQRNGCARQQSRFLHGGDSGQICSVHKTTMRTGGSAASSFLGYLRSTRTMPLGMAASSAAVRVR